MCERRAVGGCACKDVAASAEPCGWGVEGNGDQDWSLEVGLLDGDGHCRGC